MNRQEEENVSSSSLHIVVVVLGDVGRSPRMQYHTLSLLQAGHFVSLIGYNGENLIPAVSPFLGKRLDIFRFSVPSPKLVRKVKPIYFIWRILSLASCLFWTLFVRVRGNVDCLLVQNPPALPLLAVVYIFRFLSERLLCRKRPRVVVDWHNLGYSMLAPGRFRKLALLYEHAMAPYADGHFTVTVAMRDFLVRDMGLPHTSITLLPDSPSSIFQPLPVDRQHAILVQLQNHLHENASVSFLTDDSADPNTTIMTEYNSITKKYIYRSGRPALVTSSTSWTPDEDFGIFLSALLQLDTRITREHSLLHVLVIVTGKGPQKAEYEQKISKLVLHHVAIRTLWLEPMDYPKLLACADLGVSLHTSTSGLDLPMKILDLFGCRVPVCAANFACLGELVQNDVNGRVFYSDSQLCEQLWELLSPLAAIPDSPPHSFGALAKYAANLESHPRWDDVWMEFAQPMLNR